MGPRMTTLHEEHGHSMSPLEDADEDELSDKENEMDSSDGNKTLTPKTIENSPKTVEPVESIVKEEKKIETDCKVGEDWRENSRHRKTTMTSSRTLDSLSDIQIQGPKMGTPSTSSRYKFKKKNGGQLILK